MCIINNSSWIITNLRALSTQYLKVLIHFNAVKFIKKSYMKIENRCFHKA